MPSVVLTVGGARYDGWTEIRVQRSIEQVAGQFSLSVTERWSDNDEPLPIRPGAACQVHIGAVPVVTGYVDDVSTSYDAVSHSITVAGRDRTADLVDCSVPVNGGTLVGQTLLSAAQRLCKPFGIEVVSEVDARGAFRVVRNNPGESVFERLDAGAKVRAVLLVTDGSGRLVITRASSERIPTVLALGDNVLACAARFSHKDRFRDYTVAGQQEAKDEELYGESAFSIAGQAHDPLVDRHRPLYISTENLNGNADARRRAEWERNVRFGRSQSLQYTVNGWEYEPGELWPINRLVAVRDELLGLDVDRLITGVEFSLGADGERTVLTLMPREAFELIPIQDKSTAEDPWDRI